MSEKTYITYKAKNSNGHVIIRTEVTWSKRGYGNMWRIVSPARFKSKWYNNEPGSFRNHMRIMLGFLDYEIIGSWK